MARNLNKVREEIFNRIAKKNFKVFFFVFGPFSPIFPPDSDSITWAASFTAGKNLISFGHKTAFTRRFEKPLNDHYLFKTETKAIIYQIATSADNLREHIYIENR